MKYGNGNSPDLVIKPCKHFFNFNFGKFWKVQKWWIKHFNCLVGCHHVNSNDYVTHPQYLSISTTLFIFAKPTSILSNQELLIFTTSRPWQSPLNFLNLRFSRYFIKKKHRISIISDIFIYLNILMIHSCCVMWQNYFLFR